MSERGRTRGRKPGWWQRRWTGTGPDISPAFRVTAILWSVLIFGFGYLVGIWAILRHQEDNLRFQGFTPVKVIAPTREVGVVGATAYAPGSRGQLLQGWQRWYLSTWGWVDRDRGIVHLPIDVAMEMVVEEARGKNR